MFDLMTRPFSKFIENWDRWNFDEVFDEDTDGETYAVDKDLRIELGVPGMETKDINVTCNNGMLRVQGEREYQQSDDEHIVRSCCKEQLRRAWSLDENYYDMDSIKAVVNNGLLTISISRKENVDKIENARRIEVTQE
jgi:HSP20 family molecular chaperone IbpA